MKYLSESMSTEEAKKAYRALAKTMHPDVGGDEEEFKILSDEYARIMHRSAVETMPDVEELRRNAGAMVNVIAETLRDLYPRTPVLLHYGIYNITLEFKANTPIHRIVEIERVVNSFNYPFEVVCEFTREGRKSPMQARTVEGITWINMEPVSKAQLPSTITHNGRRYKMYRGNRLEMCVDTKLHNTYVAKSGGRVDTFKLLGLRT